MTRQSEPALFALIDCCASTLAAPPPHEVRLVGGLEAYAVPNDGHFTLALGLPLVHTLSVRELASIIGHELRHFEQGAAHRLTRTAARALLWPVVGAALLVDDESESWIAKVLQLALRLGMFLVFRPLSWFGMIACRIMARGQERDADRAGACVAGGSAAQSAFARIERLAHLTRTGPVTLLDMRETRDAPAAPLIARASRLPHHADDPHPAPSARIAAFAAAPTAGVIEVDAPAAELFTRLEAYTQRIVAAQRAAHVTEHGGVIRGNGPIR